ncbi:MULTISPECIES: competence type IV pilus minor pilin ComGE [Anaerococcus]|uniref:competence type IV pilus minor pilin ComGE n=1 Tax=Anaerococcus TaxID=165779 RepID=UPI001AE93FC2|nr:MULTISPECIES: competence type IV pilus minor pilin ComGE [Anaerococcus]MBP2069312.1 prepilin-type N-terminal cleavage/methylation domain-containing protein [Anaerococcus nagyae]MDU1829515.1 competence type IV pilus minor pilin ComGE [Anaerococcus sp.]MDU1865031.1 competence type IV pilus minor pilin ComGE [Anaerococcus sp.]MDU2353766.1 competence type IV pilus minor pilin ComGE [Anaerococcus sp.]MDU2565959.1 competence type IV pilus minor pilin ComGE [Anaerococcus sp.]
MKKKNKGFTLIETVVALGILSIIAILLMPSLLDLVKSSKSLKDKPQVIFALEEAIESEKASSNVEYGSRNIYVNGLEVIITRNPYDDNLDKIKANSSNYELEVLEVNNEKKRIYFN